MEGMPIGHERSSIKEKPLKFGHSLDEAIESVIQRDGYEGQIPAILLLVLGILQWVKTFPTPRRSPRS
jgi:hypothetical protein